jgi:hypothetical protein
VQRCNVQRCNVQRCNVQRCNVQRCNVQRCNVQRCNVRCAPHATVAAQRKRRRAFFIATGARSVWVLRALNPRAPRPVARSALRCGLCPHAVHACILPAGSSFAPQSAPRRRRASSQPLPAPERHAQAQPVDGHRGMVSACDLQHEIQRPASLCEHVAVPAGEDDAAAAETPERCSRSINSASAYPTGRFGPGRAGLAAASAATGP